MISRKLMKRQSEGNPIRVAWIGAGRMNTGAICQTALMKGIFSSVICDIRPEAAERAYTINGFSKNDIVITDNRITTSVYPNGGAYGPFTSVGSDAVTMRGNVWHDGSKAGQPV